jgi:hypothetical protein
VADTDTLFFQKYVVAIVDLLGQSSILSGLDEINAVKMSRGELELRFHEAFGPVLELRDDISKFFGGLEDGRDPRLPKDVRGVLADGEKLIRLAISDSVLLAVPLGEPRAPGIRIVGVSHVLQCLASVMLAGLGRRRTVRGAVDLGFGTQLSDGEVYGGALARAHEAEHTCADYSRIVVGRQVLAFIRTVRDMQESVPADRFAKQLASNCLQMLGRDNDGCTIVDYLGPYFRQQLKDQAIVRELQGVFDWVRQEAVDRERNGDMKVARKYFRLAAYFRARATTWGLVERDG